MSPECSYQPRNRKLLRRSSFAVGVQTRGTLRARSRSCTRQRRLRSTCSMLSGFTCHLELPSLGVRDSLQLRHLQAANLERLSSRSPRFLVGQRKPLGDREARCGLPNQVLRQSDQAMGARKGEIHLGSRRNHHCQSLRHAYSWVLDFQHQCPASLAITAGN